MKAFIVIGTTGEYSDRTEWLVKGFTEEEKAKDLVLRAGERAREIFSALDGDYYDFQEEESRQKNEFDPSMGLDYTGTTYYYQEVEIDER